MKPSRFIVYGLVDPRDGQVRYVGRSSTGLKRPNEHASPSILQKGGRSHKANWIRSLKNIGLSYSVLVLHTAHDVDGLGMAERFWIQELLSHGHNLTNATSGGDGGIPGYRHTPEAKALMSASRKSQPPLSEEERVKKRKLTPEQDTMVAEMYAAGATTRALSKAFGVSRPIIVKTIERLGVSMRSSTAATALYYARGGTRHAKTADHQQTICALYLAGHSAAKIGAKLSVHETTVLKVLKQIGITRRKAGGIYATPPATP